MLAAILSLMFPAGIAIYELFHRKRVGEITKSHFNGVLILTIVSFAPSIYLLNRADTDNTIRESQLYDSLHTLRFSLKEDAGENSRTMIDTVTEGYNRLKQQNEELEYKLDEYQRQVVYKDKRIDELNDEVRKAKKGISSSVDFEGNHRSTKPGEMGGNVGGTPENLIYDQILKLRKEKNYKGVIELCNKSIKDFPTWYTAHYFKAVVLLDMNVNDKNAIKLLEVIEIQEAGVPDYILKIADIYSF